MEDGAISSLSLDAAVPDFNLQAPDGTFVALHELKQKLNVILFFANIEDEEHLDIISVMRKRYKEVVDTNAEIICISAHTMDEILEKTDDMMLPFFILQDLDGSAANKYGASGAMVFSIDRQQRLRYRSHVSADTAHDVLNEALAALDIADMRMSEKEIHTWEI